MTQTIHKKCWPELFEKVLSGEKNFDLRLNDFKINPGDTLVLEEWDPDTKTYSGRSVSKQVTFVGQFPIDKLWWSQKEILEKGIMVMSLK